MPAPPRELTLIDTIDKLTELLDDEARCRELFERMVWPNGRICPKCGGRVSVEIGGKARPGLYQCADRACRFQFTVTSSVPALRGTKLPLRVRLTALWLLHKSDGRMFPNRLAEILGIRPATAKRLSLALREFLPDTPVTRSER